MIDIDSKLEQNDASLIEGN